MSNKYHRNHGCVSPECMSSGRHDVASTTYSLSTEGSSPFRLGLEPTKTKLKLNLGTATTWHPISDAPTHEAVYMYLAAFVSEVYPRVPRAHEQLSALRRWATSITKSFTTEGSPPYHPPGLQSTKTN